MSKQAALEAKHATDENNWILWALQPEAQRTFAGRGLSGLGCE